MMNQRNIENVRRKLHLSSLTETKLFDSIDRDGKGYISSTDLEVWLRLRNAGSNYTRYGRAFRRMDLNDDGRITFEEFLQMVRPVFNYSSNASQRLDLNTTRLENSYVSPSKSLRYKVHDMKEDQINQKLAEIDVLRHEIHDSKVEEDKEMMTLYRTPRDSHVFIPRESYAQIPRESYARISRESFAHVPSMVSSLKHSIYADKYRSPARKIAAEVREEILARSMDRARLRALYGSPSREFVNMYPSKLDHELGESRKWWRDRYSSPLRYTRYYSPLRSTIELDRIRDQRDRTKLRESLAIERHSLARESLNKSISQRKSELKSASLLDVKEDKVDASHLSPANKSRMVHNLRDSIWDNKMVEDKRIDLSLRYDFSLSELFNMMDYSKNGYVSLLDLERFVFDFGILLNRVDLCIIIDRFDLDRDGLLSFAEFCELFLPKQPEFKSSMQNRVERKIQSFFEYSILTKEYIKDLFKMIVNVQERFEEIKFRLSDGRVLNSDEIFKFLDKWKTGYVTQKEFELALKDAGIICSDKDVKALFDQFDRNKDGRITFDEFHSPMRSRFFY